MRWSSPLCSSRQKNWLVHKLDSTHFFFFFFLLYCNTSFSNMGAHFPQWGRSNSKHSPLALGFPVVLEAPERVKNTALKKGKIVQILNIFTPFVLASSRVKPQSVWAPGRCASGEFNSSCTLDSRFFFFPRTESLTTCHTVQKWNECPLPLRSAEAAAQQLVCIKSVCAV